jgi:hypothetical protein
MLARDSQLKIAYARAQIKQNKIYILQIHSESITRFFFSAGISEISPKTEFLGPYR